MLRRQAASWDDIYDHWNLTAERLCPQLLEPFKVERITVKTKWHLGGKKRIGGYDWIRKEDYDQRIQSMVQSPGAFFNPRNMLKKGPQRTVELLDQCGDDDELRAALWLHACWIEFQPLLHPDPKNKISLAMSHGLHVADQSMGGSRMGPWHFAMRHLIPETFISPALINALNTDDELVITELAVWTASLLVINYRAVEYREVFED